MLFAFDGFLEFFKVINYIVIKEIDASADHCSVWVPFFSQSLCHLPVVTKKVTALHCAVDITSTNVLERCCNLSSFAL